MVRAISTKQWMLGLVVALLATAFYGCGGDDGTSRISVTLFGWIDAGDGEFVQGMPEYPAADQIRVRITQPDERAILSEEVFPIADGRALFPEAPAGDGLRMDFEIIGDSSVIASGATPKFNVGETISYRAYRTMISPVNAFAPVGSMVRIDGSNEERLVPSRFDGRELDSSLGRVGHTATATESGLVLIVGGGQVGAFHQPATTPDLQGVVGDIQLFDPATGYFTELAGDDEARRSNTIGADRLQVPRAFHTVTALGNDRFLVVGGYTQGSTSISATDSIEIINLNASPGARVQPLTDAAQSPMLLQNRRAMHTATLRESDGRVIIAGGRSGNEVRNTFEIINPNPQNPLVEGGLSMNSARVGHSAVLMGDGSSVWLLGGRTDTEVLGSTELISDGESGTSSSSTANLQRPRYGASARFLGPSVNNFVLLAGGFTGLTSGATRNYELGRPDREDFLTDSAWQLSEARGNAALFELPQSRELLLIGGLNPDFRIVGNADRLQFQGLDAAVPFSVDASAGSMYRLRSGFATAPVSNGRYLITGGQGQNEAARQDAEYFNPRDPVLPRR